MAKTAIATYITARGTVRSGSRASSDMLETVSMPVYASIAIGIERKKLLQVGATPKWMFEVRMCGEKTRTKPSSTSRSCVAKSVTARTTLTFADSWTPTMFRITSAAITTIAADDVPRVLAERRPEDREVVRDEERRDGDRRDVVEHLRPRGLERDGLVEGVAGEARGAARLGVAHRPLGVRRGGAREDEAGDDEDDRRQAERVDRDYAEGVVDRRADVAVRGGEERVRSEDALELLGLATPSCHGGTVVRSAVALRPQPAGGDHHAARRVAQEEQDFARERTVEAAPRLDRRADDDELGAALGRDPRDLLAELPGRVRTISRRTPTPYEPPPPSPTRAAP